MGHGTCLRRGALVAADGLLDAALCGERGKRLTDIGRAHAAGVPELRERQRPIGVRQDVRELVDRRGRRWRRWWGRRRVDDLQGERVADAAEGEGERVLGGRRGAMLDGEQEAVVNAAQIEIRVAPRVELGAAAEGLAAAHRPGAFAGVMDEHDGEREAAL